MYIGAASIADCATRGGRLSLTLTLLDAHRVKNRE
jgi:hypothetical protein